MSGISEALVATAVGLLVAIPAVIAFNAYQRVVKRHMSNADSMVKMLMAHVGDKK
jgi:biopolymer transport protein ExbB